MSEPQGTTKSEGECDRSSTSSPLRSKQEQKEQQDGRNSDSLSIPKDLHGNYSDISGKKEMEAQHSSSSHPSKLKHFSHSHELTFEEERKKKNYDAEVVFCNACEEPVFGPRYSCNTCVDPNSTFSLHKSCAEELSREIIEHPIHWHELTFECKTEPSAELFTCHACHQPCRLAYACSPCDLAFDLKCASNWGHILDREKPHVHQFSVLRKGIPFDCEVCGKSQDSLPYLCTICHLLVGKECTQSLPHAIKISSHEDPLMLIWFLEPLYPKDQICKICYTSTNRSRAVYGCGFCDYVAHTLCSMDKITDADDAYIQLYITRLRSFKLKLREIQPSERVGEREIKHFSHDHTLTLNDELRDNDAITCNGCMGPITISTGNFYCCTQDCLFFLHEKCARLRKKELHPFHPHRLQLLTKAHTFDGLFNCRMCHSLSQGFCYYCKRCDIYLDLQCMSISNPLAHDAHGHTLDLNSSSSKDHCRGCGISLADFRFSCFKCKFHLCIPCVKLPATARYKYQDDPLKLAYHSVENELGEYYCDICEGERDPTHWFYKSKHCDFECHPHCILGRHPQVKLGSSYKLDAHPHVVTYVDKRRSVIPLDKRERILPCNGCGEPCEGLVFECSVCNKDYHRKETCLSHYNTTAEVTRPC
ncbi:unnamed protein product [Prunus armeniaca]